MLKLWIKSTWIGPPQFFVPCVQKLITQKNHIFSCLFKVTFFTLKLVAMIINSRTSIYIPSTSVPWTTQKICFGLQHIFLELQNNSTCLEATFPSSWLIITCVPIYKHRLKMLK
jgi:hypothetical protein